MGEERSPKGFFLPVDTADVADAYTNIMMWVQRQARYFDHAKAKFATESKKEVKLPDLCDQFGVRRANTFAMLRGLNVRFDWERGS